MLKSDRIEHSSTSECKIFTLTRKKNAPSKGFVDDTLNLFSLCIRVEVNSNMHFYPTWFASIFFLFRLSFCFFHFHLNFLGLFNERRDLIYWFPLNTHWEYSEISCESFDLFFSCLREITEGVKIQFCDLKYECMRWSDLPMDVAKQIQFGCNQTSNRSARNSVICAAVFDYYLFRRKTNLTRKLFLMNHFVANEQWFRIVSRVLFSLCLNRDLNIDCPSWPLDCNTMVWDLRQANFQRNS